MGMLIIPMIIMTAFAVDFGSWLAQGQRMQRAADAASLAGVVWTGDPIDPMKWDTVARATATKNGFTDGVNGVSVDVVKTAGNRVKVTIQQDGEQYFSGVVMKDGQRLNRDSTAEYVLPVPLGSPRNFLGTGVLGKGAAGTAYEREKLWAAVSGQCTDKVQGDRIAAAWRNYSNSNSCSGTANGEYDTTNYEYYIELPESRSYATDVILYHANFVNNNNDCEGGGYLNSTYNPNEFCPGGLDGKAAMPTTFTLYESDGTVLDDTDNRTAATAGVCSSPGTGTNGTRTFNTLGTGNTNTNYSFNPSSTNFNGSSTASGYNQWWRICTIPASAPGGKYILRVRNQATTAGTAAQNNGSNAFSIVATPSSPQRLCDSRTDTTCPKVFAKEFLSIYAVPGGAAEFFLAEIGPEHAGKKVHVQLWDAAEGATEIRVKKPSTSTAWVDQTFSYSSSCQSGPGNAGTNVTRIYNGGSVLPFNSCLITIEFTLPATYTPPTNNAWWRIYYAYNSGATDRTTWSVNILGDPVHLIE